MPRTRNRYDPRSPKPYRLSRSKLEDFTRCPRCFYLDRRLGIGRPTGPPFNLNSAVDVLLKREFDAYRERAEPHPYMVAAGVDAVPARHPELDTWRENFRGVSVLHEATNFEVFGAIDDLWVTPGGGYLVVDYKATAKNGPVGIDAGWQGGYRRQMELYQWLLRRRGLEVLDTAWFVYCNGRRGLARFDDRLEFEVRLIPYRGSDAWVEPALCAARETLCADAPPPPAQDCEFCRYRAEARERE